MSILHKNEKLGLVAYWKFDGDATDSQGSYDGTVVTASLTTGKLKPTSNGGYDFDGTNDYIHNQQIPNLGTDYTITLWLNPDTVNATRRTFLHLNENNTIAFSLDTDFPQDLQCASVSATSLVGTGTWKHIGFVHDSTPEGTVYIDGAAAGNGASDANNDSNQHDTLGSKHDFTAKYDGQMDEVRVYNRQLTLGEIKAVMYRPLKRAHIGGFI